MENICLVPSRVGETNHLRLCVWINFVFGEQNNAIRVHFMFFKCLTQAHRKAPRWIASKGLVTTLQLSWRHGKPVADEETATRVSEGNRVLHQQHERGVINLQYRAVSQARGREQRYDSPLARTMKSKSRPFLDLPAIESRPPTSEPNVCTTVQHTTRGQP